MTFDNGPAFHSAKAVSMLDPCGSICRGILHKSPQTSGFDLRRGNASSAQCGNRYAGIGDKGSQMPPPLSRPAGDATWLYAAMLSLQLRDRRRCAAKPSKPGYAGCERGGG